MRVLDIPDWPPQPGGAFSPAYRSPSSEQAIVKRIEGTNRAVVTFVCGFDGNEHSYDFDARSVELAGKVAKLLQSNIGKSLMQIGFLTLE